MQTFPFVPILIMLGRTASSAIPGAVHGKARDAAARASDYLATCASSADETVPSMAGLLQSLPVTASTPVAKASEKEQTMVRVGDDLGGRGFCMTMTEFGPMPPPDLDVENFRSWVRGYGPSNMNHYWYRFWSKDATDDDFQRWKNSWRLHGLSAGTNGVYYRISAQACDETALMGRFRFDGKVLKYEADKFDHWYSHNHSLLDGLCAFPFRFNMKYTGQVLLEPCNASNVKQQWRAENVTVVKSDQLFRLVSVFDPKFCLTWDEGRDRKRVLFADCGHSSAKQNWVMRPDRSSYTHWYPWRQYYPLMRIRSTTPGFYMGDSRTQGRMAVNRLKPHREWRTALGGYDLIEVASTFVFLGEHIMLVRHSWVIHPTVDWSPRRQCVEFREETPHVGWSKCEKMSKSQWWEITGMSHGYSRIRSLYSPDLCMSVAKNLTDCGPGWGVRSSQGFQMCNDSLVWLLPCAPTGVAVFLGEKYNQMWAIEQHFPTVAPTPVPTVAPTPDPTPAPTPPTPKPTSRTYPTCKIYDTVWATCWSHKIWRWGAGKEGKEQALKNCQHASRHEKRWGICEDILASARASTPKCVFRGWTVWITCGGQKESKWGVGPEGRSAALGNCNHAVNHQKRNACAEMSW